MARNILDAVYGCLIGGAIGDAMRAPVENWHYADIRKEYGRVEGFMPHRHGAGLPGSITDDSTLRYYMCLAIVRKGRPHNSRRLRPGMAGGPQPGAALRHREDRAGEA